MRSKKIIENYRDNEIMRNKFHNFIAEVFPSADFKEWYSRGFWSDNFIPYSIVDSGKIISNVSVSKMDIILKGKRIKAVQIGAVGTLPEYCNKGFSRQLMTYIIDKYKNQVDLFFLFANETVMEFYPKFGFKNVKENLFEVKLQDHASKYSAKKLDINDKEDFSILLTF